MSRYWYFYKGSGNDTDPSRYTSITNNPVSSCTSGQTVCAVYGLPNSIDSTIPKGSELAGRLASYIVQARLTGSFYPVFPQKPYVYLKNP